MTDGGCKSPTGPVGGNCEPRATARSREGAWGGSRRRTAAPNANESRGKRYLLHTAKGNGRTDPATCTTVADKGRLLESVASAANLAQALLNVLRNKGAPGVDGESVEEVADYAPTLLPKVQTALLQDTYRPGDIRRVWIPKQGGGGRRGLGIPNVESLSRSEEHTSELQSRGHLVCRLLLEK